MRWPHLDKNYIKELRNEPDNLQIGAHLFQAAAPRSIINIMRIVPSSKWMAINAFNSIL